MARLTAIAALDLLAEAAAAVDDAVEDGEEPPEVVAAEEPPEPEPPVLEAEAEAEADVLEDSAEEAFIVPHMTDWQAVMPLRSLGWPSTQFAFHCWQRKKGMVCW